jgi:hypothetical protein
VWRSTQLAATARATRQSSGNVRSSGRARVSPFLGAILLSVGAGKNYNLLYITAAVLTFLGAVAIFPVKKVK